VGKAGVREVIHFPTGLFGHKCTGADQGIFLNNPQPYAQDASLAHPRSGVIGACSHAGPGIQGDGQPTGAAGTAPFTGSLPRRRSIRPECWSWMTRPRNSSLTRQGSSWSARRPSNQHLIRRLVVPPTSSCARFRRRSTRSPSQSWGYLFGRAEGGAVADLSGWALCWAARAAAAAAASAAAARAASCGVIQASMGPSAARHTLP
jgi:hypothetical protein